jgi:hypothetical protein
VRQLQLIHARIVRKKEYAIVTEFAQHPAQRACDRITGQVSAPN